MDASRPTLEQIIREEGPLILASLIRHCGDFELAEESLQEAFAIALERWPREGLPRQPAAWLTTTAQRKAIDRLRRDAVFRSKQRQLRGESHWHVDPAPVPEDEGVDDRLRLIFTCCHPALAPEAQIALTLRTLGGLSTAEIARAFLVPETTMAQRLVRVKRKIREAGIPYRVPGREQFAERLDAVLTVVYLIFNEGYAASGGDEVCREVLAGEAIRLGRLVAALLPGEAEAGGLLALMLFHHARREARTDEGGNPVLMADQDRRRYDAPMIAEAAALLERTLRAGKPGPYQIEAAIAGLHAQAESAAATDWPQILALYGELLRRRPTPVVELNRAVALAMVEGPAAGLGAMERGDLDRALAEYAPYHVARAELFRRMGRSPEAMAAFERALALTENGAQRRHLMGRIAETREGSA